MIATERRMLLSVKIETTEGTAISTAGADANNLIYDVSGIDPDIANAARKPVAADFSPFASISGGRKAAITFKVEVKGSGTLGTAPTIGKLLKLAGFGETLVSSTSATYDPISVAIPSATADFFTLPESGSSLRFRLTGCRMSAFSLVAKVGEPTMIQFTLSGVYAGVTDQTTLTASGLETTLPPALLSAAFAAHSFSHKISGFTINENLSGVYREDINLAAGYLSYAITGREPSLSFDPEQELVATHDYFGIQLADTLSTLTTAIGATSGNICTITAPKVQYMSVKPGKRGNLAIFTIDAALRRSSGNDHVKFAFT